MNTEVVRVVFFASNPEGTSRLSLDREIREIELRVKIAGAGDRIEIESAWAARPADLLDKLNEYQPHVVHFSGHGTKAGEIILSDNQGRPRPVSAAALKSLFTNLKDNIHLVVLNACFSREQGNGIAEVIDYVVGMADEIGDEAAVTFASAFYGALGFKRTVPAAFQQGLTALLLEGIPEDKTPVLITRAGVTEDRQHSEKNPEVTVNAAAPSSPDATIPSGPELEHMLTSRGPWRITNNNDLTDDGLVGNFTDEYLFTSKILDDLDMQMAWSVEHETLTLGLEDTSEIKLLRLLADGRMQGIDKEGVRWTLRSLR